MGVPEARDVSGTGLYYEFPFVYWPHSQIPAGRLVLGLDRTKNSGINVDGAEQFHKHDRTPGVGGSDRAAVGCGPLSG